MLCEQWMPLKARNMQKGTPRSLLHGLIVLLWGTRFEQQHQWITCQRNCWSPVIILWIWALLKAKQRNSGDCRLFIYYLRLMKLSSSKQFTVSWAVINDELQMWNVLLVNRQHSILIRRRVQDERHCLHQNIQDVHVPVGGSQVNRRATVRWLKRTRS